MNISQAVTGAGDTRPSLNLKFSDSHSMYEKYTSFNPTNFISKYEHFTGRYRRGRYKLNLFRK